MTMTLKKIRSTIGSVWTVKDFIGMVVSIVIQFVIIYKFPMMFSDITILRFVMMICIFGSVLEIRQLPNERAYMENVLIANACYIAFIQSEYVIFVIFAIVLSVLGYLNRSVKRRKKKHAVDKAFTYFAVSCMCAVTLKINVDDALNVKYGLVSEYDTVENNRDTIMLFEEDTWQVQTLTDRYSASAKIADITANSLGLRRKVNLKLGHMEDEYLMGVYNHDDNCIYINVDLISYGSAEDVLDTLFHEMRHAYQHNIVDLLDELPEDRRNLELFHEAWVYKENFENYVDPCIENASYDEYALQPVEYDATLYAQAAVNECMDLIKTWSEKNNQTTA